MKKLLIVILVFMMSGCGYATPDTQIGIVIEYIHSSKDDYCFYYGKGNEDMFSLASDFRIRDKCGKFNIGDTIKLIK